MNKYLLHIMVRIFSIISYTYVNNVNIAPLTMCSLFIKMICCNRSITDKDMVYDPANISVPFEDVKKVAASVENVIDDVLAPQTKTVKDIANLFDKK